MGHTPGRSRPPFKALVAAALIAGFITAAAAGGGPEPAGPDERDAPAASSMRRLLSISPGLGTSGGLWIDLELPEEYRDQQPPASAAVQFSTDFSRAMISYDSVISGGPPKDGIPSIDRPRFVDQDTAAEWISDAEPVIVYAAGGEQRIYPLQILTWHEIVNDTVGGTSVAVTYCPLCNTSVVFDRVFDGQVLEFGVSGRLIYSNMLMYDRSTESWWIQATGLGVAGAFAGQRLRLLPSMVVSWRDARRSFPRATVLSRDTGHQRPYGRNPYDRYDSSARPFLYDGPELDPETGTPFLRVIAVYYQDESFAADYETLRDRGVVSFDLGGRPAAIFWQPGTASALDAQRIAEGRDVGTATAFFAEINGERFDFSARDGRFADRQTGSTWDITGLAVEGPLSGARLEVAPSVQHFIFSWAAFHPE